MQKCPADLAPETLRVVNLRVLHARLIAFFGAPFADRMRLLWSAKCQQNRERQTGEIQLSSHWRRNQIGEPRLFFVSARYSVPMEVRDGR